jgi:hypothetical protein
MLLYKLLDCRSRSVHHHCSLTPISTTIFLNLDHNFNQLFESPRALKMALKSLIILAASILLFNSNGLAHPTNSATTGVSSNYLPTPVGSSSSNSICIKEEQRGKLVESCKKRDQWCWKEESHGKFEEKCRQDNKSCLLEEQHGKIYEVCKRSDQWCWKEESRGTLIEKCRRDNSSCKKEQQGGRLTEVCKKSDQWCWKEETSNTLIEKCRRN